MILHIFLDHRTQLSVWLPLVAAAHEIERVFNDARRRTGMPFSILLAFALQIQPSVPKPMTYTARASFDNLSHVFPSMACAGDGGTTPTTPIRQHNRTAEVAVTRTTRQDAHRRLIDATTMRSPRGHTAARRAGLPSSSYVLRVFWRLPLSSGSPPLPAHPCPD